MHAVQRQKHPANMENELLRRTQENRNSAWWKKRPKQWKRMREWVRENTSQKQKKRKLTECVYSCTRLSFLVFLAKSKRLISYKSQLQNPSSIRESQTSGSSKGFWSGPDPFKALTQLSRGGTRVWGPPPNTQRFSTGPIKASYFKREIWDLVRSIPKILKF